MTALIGRTLGQYRVIERIGQGGMATVYKAYQPGLDRHVALKVLPPIHAEQPGFTERFQREAKAIANLHHPNILPVHDSGQEEGYSFIVMRHIEGARTLKEVMKESSLNLAQATDLIGQIAAALDHAHQRGVIHRDVKPSNVLMDGNWALLTDFGLAKMTEASVKLTGSGVGLGTPAYMSPEQGQGLEIDLRTDVYSLGVILFEMLTGQIPHDAETPFAIVLKRMTEPLPLPRAVNPEIPEAVERVILKALAREPGNRFANAGAMAATLKQAVSKAVVEEVEVPSLILPEPSITQLPEIPIPALPEAQAPPPSQAEPPAVVLPPARLAFSWKWGAGIGIAAVLIILSIVGLSIALGSKGRATETPETAALAPTPTPTLAPTQTPSPIPPTDAPETAALPPTPTPTPAPSQTPSPIPPTDTPKPAPTDTPPPPTPMTRVVQLHDGDMRHSDNPPDIIAYANAGFKNPPGGVTITDSGGTWPDGLWRYNEVIALMEEDQWVEAAHDSADTTAVGVQLLGDTNDGWVRVLIDSTEAWTGSIYGSDTDPFNKYLEISNLTPGPHTVRVENMGINGDGGGDDVTVFFFGFGPASSPPPPTPTRTPTTVPPTSTPTPAANLAGKTVFVMGILTGNEEARFGAVNERFTKMTGIKVVYEGDREFETVLNVRVAAGDPPDVALLPQPGLMKHFAKNEILVPLWPEIIDRIDSNYAPVWKELGSYNGTPYGVFHRVSIKSLVWYPKPAFEAAGYEVPITWEELMSLSDQIVADGGTPWCIGLESGTATGWIATDWIEDILLRSAGPDVYDRWVNHEIPFNDSRIKDAAEIMGRIWLNPKYVLGGVEGILTTSFIDAPLPMFEDPPQCWLHRQAHFIINFFPEEVQDNLDEEVGVFGLPPIDPQWSLPTLGSGDVVVLFNDRPEVRAYMEFLTTGESVEPWARAGGALFPHQDQDQSWYASHIERKAAELLLNSKTFRFDASDLMPAKVGVGAFWKGMVDYVDGADLDTVLAEIEASWP